MFDFQSLSIMVEFQRQEIPKGEREIHFSVVICTAANDCFFQRELCHKLGRELKMYSRIVTLCVEDGLRLKSIIDGM